MLPMYVANKKNVFVTELYNGTSSEKEETIKINWSDISRRTRKLNPDKLILRDASSGLLIPSKVEYINKVPQVLHFIVKVSAGTKRIFEISKS